MPDTLPCYELDSVPEPEQELRRLARDVFGLKNFTICQEAGTSIYIAREAHTSREVELDATRGSVWMADWDLLWNPHVEASKLPSVEEAKAMARSFLEQHRLLPNTNALPHTRLITDDPIATHTIRTIDTGSGLKPLDVHVGFPIIAEVRNRVGYLVGQDRWSVTFGDGGRIINCVVGNLPLKPVALIEESPALDPPDVEVADAARTVTRTFAYERIRDNENRERLLPVHLSRDRSRTKPHFRRFPATVRTQAVLNGLLQGPPGLLRRSDATSLREVRAGLQNDQRFAATWTVDASEIEAVRTVQTRGFVDGVRRLGWHTESFVEDGALECHWSARREDFVEQVDFAYYCGHASQEFWQLYPPADPELSQDNVNDRTDPVQYGRRHVNWIGLAACGPLQDRAVVSDAGYTTAINGWRNMFLGILGLCAFANTSLPHQDMGRVLARALVSRSVPKAWFRAGRECQPLAGCVAERASDCFVWMASLTCDDERPTFDLSIDDARTGLPRNTKPTRVMVMWTPA